MSSSKHSKEDQFKLKLLLLLLEKGYKHRANPPHRSVEMFKMTNSVKKRDNGHNEGLLITGTESRFIVALLSIKAIQAQSESQQLALPPSLLFPDAVSGHLCKHSYANASLFERAPWVSLPVCGASLSREIIAVKIRSSGAAAPSATIGQPTYMSGCCCLSRREEPVMWENTTFW